MLMPNSHVSPLLAFWPSVLVSFLSPCPQKEKQQLQKKKTIQQTYSSLVLVATHTHCNLCFYPSLCSIFNIHHCFSTRHYNSRWTLEWLWLSSVGDLSHVCIIFELTIWMQLWDQLQSSPLSGKVVFLFFYHSHYQVPQGKHIHPMYCVTLLFFLMVWRLVIKRLWQELVHAFTTLNSQNCNLEELMTVWVH